MNEDVARALVRLYSRSWRERFGLECEALLLELPATPAVIVDCIGNAVSSRCPKYVGIVVSGISLVVLATYLGASLHVAGNAHASEAVASVSKRPDVATSSAPRGWMCYRGVTRSRARCA